MLEPSVELVGVAVLALLAIHALAWRDVVAHAEENEALSTMLRTWTRFANPRLAPDGDSPLCRYVLHLAAREGYAGGLHPRRAFDHVVVQLQRSAERGHRVAQRLAELEHELSLVGSDSEIVAERVEEQGRELTLATKSLDRALARRAAGQKAG